jgi:superfamily I DNA and RNA helicase
MEFDVKVQNLAMIYYLIGRSHPQKRLMWVIYGTKEFSNNEVFIYDTAVVNLDHFFAVNVKIEIIQKLILFF